LLQNKNVSFEKSFGCVLENNWDGSTKKNLVGAPKKWCWFWEKNLGSVGGVGTKQNQHQYWG